MHFDCFLISVSLERIRYRETINVFWSSIGGAFIDDAASRLALPQGSLEHVSSVDDFHKLFRVDAWPQEVVLIIDELSELYIAEQDVRDDFLRAFRVIRNNKKTYAIRSVIAAGTFGIVKLNPSNSAISPFNVADRIPNPYFTVDEVRKLFYEFAQDRRITIDDAVVEDIWAQSNGCVTLLNRCTRAHILS